MSTTYSAWIGYGVRLKNLGKYDDVMDAEGMLGKKYVLEMDISDDWHLLLREGFANNMLGPNVSVTPAMATFSSDPWVAERIQRGLDILGAEADSTPSWFLEVNKF